MHCVSWLVAGAIATLAQLLFEVITQALRLTRMSLPFLLGTAYTDNRSKAMVLGLINHLLNGLIFAAIYILLFKTLHPANWWFGGLLGLAQGLLVLVLIMPLIPEVHPRMATERQGPIVRRQLEPPGFLALNYGLRTPMAIIASHILFGVVIGAVYHM
jgi:uncharacterized membrane protein YagU involved in acid resistance